MPEVSEESNALVIRIRLVERGVCDNYRIMTKGKYLSLSPLQDMNRRDFVRTVGTGTAAAGRLLLGVPEFPTFGQEKKESRKVQTNIDEFMSAPRTKHSIPGPFPGHVVKITDKRCLQDERFDAQVIAAMFEKGLTSLTGKNMRDSFRLFFEKKDIVGIKVNPVGPPLINTRPELAEAVVRWLETNGIPRGHIFIWDRFDYMLADAGFTPQRFVGVQIEGLQTMDENGNKWRDEDGNHLSIANFDRNVFYFAKDVVGKNVAGYRDDEAYLNQHVFNGEYSYFGKLLTQKITKIINLAAYKNTGNGISMATKNISYGSICNSARLHQPLFFNVCTEVLAAPVIRDKLVLNVTDGLRGQYDGGPDKNAQFVYANHSLYFATDPFALDMVCHREILAKRREMGREVNGHPRFTEYLYYAERLGLGVASPEKIKLLTIQA